MMKLERIRKNNKEKKYGFFRMTDNDTDSSQNSLENLVNHIICIRLPHAKEFTFDDFPKSSTKLYGYFSNFKPYKDVVLQKLSGSIAIISHNSSMQITLDGIELILEKDKDVIIPLETLKESNTTMVVKNATSISIITLSDEYNNIIRSKVWKNVHDIIFTPESTIHTPIDKNNEIITFNYCISCGRKKLCYDCVL